MLGQLNLIFKDITPLFVLVSLVFLFGSIYFCRQYFKKFFLQFSRNTWAILLVIFLASLVIRLVVPTIYHRICLDEVWYMEAARSMLETGLPGSYVKSIGWPFLIAIAFFVFGFKSSVVFYTSIFLGAATIFPVFFLAYIMSAKEKWSLFLTFLFSLFPLHILWSASGETNVAALFFVILTIFFYFLYYKNEKNSYSLFWLCLASASFAAQFRPEFYAFYPLFIFGYFLYKKPFFNFEKSDLKFILPLILLVALSLPNLFVVLNFQLSYNWLANESGGRITGNNWSIKNLIENTANYGPGLFKNELAILFLAIAGIGYSFFKKRKEALFVLVWLFSFWIIYFSSWLQTLGERTRFYISFYPGLTILALYGFLLFQDKINQLSIRNFYKKFLMSCLILSVLFFGALSVFIFFKNYSYNNEFALDTAVTRLVNKDISKNCVIVSLPHTALGVVGPYKFIDLGSFLTEEAFRNDVFNKNDCVLFFESLYCSWPGYGFIEQCQEIKNKFNAQIFKAYKIKDAQVQFYKISR